MIKVQCRTNLDKYKMRQWPTQLACRPMIGDFVQADCGARLKIHEITHVDNKQCDGHSIVHGPSLILELHN